MSKEEFKEKYTEEQKFYQAQIDIAKRNADFDEVEAYEEYRRITEEARLEYGDKVRAIKTHYEAVAQLAHQNFLYKVIDLEFETFGGK